jgi:hypothetical protein
LSGVETSVMGLAQFVMDGLDEELQALTSGV